MPIVFGMLMKMTCGNSSNKSQAEYHGIAELLLFRQSTAVFNGQAAFRKGCVVDRKVGDVAESRSGKIGLCARAESKVFAVGPVEQIVSAGIFRFGIVRHFIPLIADVAEYLLCNLVHFNLKTFVQSWTSSALDVGRKPRTLFDRESIARQMCRFQCKTMDEGPLPTTQALPRESVHHIEIDVGESGCSGLHHRRDCLAHGTGPSYSSQVAIIHRFCAEAYAGCACLKQLRKALLGDGRGVPLNGDFTV